MVGRLESFSGLDGRRLTQIDGGLKKVRGTRVWVSDGVDVDQSC